MLLSAETDKLLTDGVDNIQIIRTNLQLRIVLLTYTSKSFYLDTSIKKNTGFIKKLRKGFTKENKNSLLKDIGEISLEKYLSEIISTINEVTSNISNKNDEILTAIEVISAMHQRFNANFTIEFFGLFLTNFTNPTEELTDKDENFRINKLKGNLKVLTELYLVNIFRTEDMIESRDILPFYLQKKVHRKEPFIFSVLKEMLNYKFKFGYTLSVGTVFVKTYSSFFDNEDSSWDMFIKDEDLKSLLQSLFKAFSEAVINRMIELNKNTTKLMKEHKKCQIRTGKLKDEYIEEHDLLMPILEKFHAAAEIFSPLFGIELPQPAKELDTEEDDNEPDSMIVTQVVPVNERVWESEDMRLFYEVLPDINSAANHPNQSDSTSSNSASKLNSFFEHLEMIETKEQIDKLSENYWTDTLDNKATRNRLLKFLIETQDWSKINLYARFVATNTQFMQELTSELIEYLDNGFRHQLHTNKINVKNIIFYCHMIKFKLIPTFMIFHKIRTLIINLHVPNNVEILTIFFEHSGKFLLNHPEYKVHMEAMVSLLRNKMKEKQFTMNFKSALDNILNLLYPPSVKSLNDSVKENPQQLFYRVLVRKELGNFENKQILILLREANWKDEAIYQTMFSLFSEPDKISYQNIPVLTKLLDGLYVYHRKFVIEIIDQILDNIDEGLEVDDFSENLQRVAQVRYMTEIFNLEMIKSSVILDVMYQIIRYGYNQNMPSPQSRNPSDLPNNYFRIQIISTILLNINRFPSIFTKQLKTLLHFFEYYTFTKAQPLPMETKFKVEDIFTKYSSMLDFERSSSLEESATRFQSLIMLTSKNIKKPMGENRGTVSVTRNIRNAKNDTVVDDDSTEGSDDDEDDDNDEGRYTDENDDSDSTSDEGIINLSDSSDGTDDSGEDSEDSSDSDSESDSDETSDDSDSSSEEEDFDDIEADRDAEAKRIYAEYETKLQNAEEQKAQDELEKQFQKLMLDSLDERRSEKNASNNMPVMSSMNSNDRPKKMLLKKPVLQTRSNNDTDDKKVAFTFLSKSGKKTSSRVLELPTDVKFVNSVLEEEERVKNEREKIKNIVLKQSFD
ncbi:hypothetical protein C6P45_004184 [Maudiozyma exigua]|uniref:MIF4G domain-containing protein n=1 Tax=Maudiozyma exigua TaxID=34358 RepID=A0A9P6WAT4_MAUEX|nr:hypothetical protein C6P45_004184 [Kazachstania exigua]